MELKHRGEDGKLIEPVQVGSTPKIEDRIAEIGMQLTQEKLANMQKDAIIDSLGAQVAQMKLEIMALKGGGE